MAACRVAIVDSGINPNHPHVGTIVGGVHIRESGLSDDFIDLLGHGTAVAGAICERAPGVEILVVRVFERSLAATINQLVSGLSWALDHDAKVINLSLGTVNPEHHDRLTPVIQRAVDMGARIVSARSLAGKPCLPGCMEGVLGVEPDAKIPRMEVRFVGDCAYASPYPRPIPGLPPEANLSGVSFAVANVSGHLCAQIMAKRKLGVA